MRRASVSANFLRRNSFICCQIIALHQKANKVDRSLSKEIRLPEEIRGSEIWERRGSAATTEGESRLLVHADHRRGRRESRVSFRAVTRVVSLTDGGTGYRFGISVVLTRVESRTGTTARRPGGLGLFESS